MDARVDGCTWADERTDENWKKRWGTNNNKSQRFSCNNRHTSQDELQKNRLGVVDRKILGPESLLDRNLALNPFGAKFQTTFVVCFFFFFFFFFFNKLSLTKTFIYVNLDRLNVKQFAKALYYCLWQWKSFLMYPQITNTHSVCIYYSTSSVKHRSETQTTTKKVESQWRSEARAKESHKQDHDCITKTHLFKYIENFTTKKWQFFR